MKKVIKGILLAIAGVLLLAIIAFAAVYYTRIRTLSTLRKITNYEDGYDLYSITIKYDYSLQDIIDSGFTDTQGFVDAVFKDSLPLIPVKIELPSYGCSVYRAFTEDDEAIMGRNYDFKLDTSCMAVFCEPKDGYKSVSFAALNNIHANHPTSDFKQKMACLAAPHCALDGVNEKGVSIAVLTLDSEPTDQNTGRGKITSSLAIRLVLDYCATTEEAVDMLSKYDMYAVNGRDYHYFISDASGNSVVVEYDCESLDRTFTVTPIEAVTNFYGMYIDKVVSNQRNGIYGHGKERYDRMMEIIEPNEGVLDSSEAWAALQSAASEPKPDSVTSNTQWSIVFNNTNATADITLRRKWGEVFSFTVDEFVK